MSAPRSTTLIAGLAATLTLAAASVAMLSAQQSAPAYKDASRPVAERVADLLGRMTLEEKVAQLTTRWTTLKPLQDAEGTFVPAGAPALLGQGLGQLARPSEIGGTEAGPHVRGPRKHAEFTNAVQKWVHREHAGSASRSCSTRRRCTASSRRRRRTSRCRSPSAPPGTRRWSSGRWPSPPRKRARAAARSCCRR